MYLLLHSSAITVQTMQLLNCCRVLTRIIPFIFESTECNEWEEKFFWTPRVVEAVPTDSGLDQKTQTQYNHLPPRGELLITSKYTHAHISTFY
jgi:hypothetical protein